MYCRSPASAASSSYPAKQLPGSMSAIRLRLVTSSRLSVRLTYSWISLHSQSVAALSATTRSWARTASRSPALRSTQVPSRGSLVRRRRLGRAVHRDGDDPAGAVQHRRHVVVGQPVGALGPPQWRQDNAPVACPRRGGREGGRALLDDVEELPGRYDLVDQPPLHGRTPADAVTAGGEHVGAVLAYSPLVHQPGQTARAGQHAEQRDLGHRHRGGAVVDEQDPLAGQRDLV